MAIPLSHFQTISNDQIPDSLLDRNFLTNKTVSIFSGPNFPFARRKKRNLVINSSSSSSVEHGLQPRPKPKPTKPNQKKIQTLELVNDSEQTQIREKGKPVSGLCSQIEKLVFYKRYEEALELFEFLECEESDSFEVGSSTFDALVDACICLRSIKGVKRVFNYMNESNLEWDQYLRNRALLMHVKCGMMIDARKLFDEMPERNLVSWNTIILGLVEKGDYIEAFHLFLYMWGEFSEGDTRMFSMMIKASSGMGLACLGSQLHSCVLKLGIDEDIFVSCALIDMYSKCGSIEDAKGVFYGMPEKTVVGWNTIIAGYALHGYSEEALEMYYEMRKSGVKMDHFTYSIIIRICARLASLEHAKQAHACLVRNGFGGDMVANTALVDFYCKWGRVEDARHVFDNMPSKNLISWNALIDGYGNHGRGPEAVEMFERMLSEGMVLNHLTFRAVLSACSYSGLSDVAWEIFDSMTRDYKIKPRAMHFACMIGLLGKEGLLDEAFALIKDAPFNPTENMWAALLTACRVHKNLELGKYAAEKLYGMEPMKLSNYVMLLNIYNSSGRFHEAAEVVNTLRRKGLRMLPACSWIEVKKQPYFFVFGDKSHPQIKEIYRRLDNLMIEIAKHGYITAEKSLLSDVDEHEERISSYHSEKLAIACGLVNTSDSTSLRVVQSHRICNDCHNVIKLIALVTRREIVVRDASRFHHFRDGSCSCGDYW